MLGRVHDECVNYRCVKGWGVRAYAVFTTTFYIQQPLPPARVVYLHRTLYDERRTRFNRSGVAVARRVAAVPCPAACSERTGVLAHL